MTGVLTEVSASCEGPGGALIYLDTSVMAATPEGCGSGAGSRINDQGRSGGTGVQRNTGLKRLTNAAGEVARLLQPVL